VTATRTNTDVKEELLVVAKEMLDCGLVHGTAGNMAARLPDGNVVLTPSSLDYRTMTLDDLVVCDLEGNVVEGKNGPTTEKMLHLACLTGSLELADEVSRHLADRAAVLMANHGLFVVGRNPSHSLELAQLVELTAEIVWGAMLLGEIVPLPEEIVERFSGYYKMLRGRS
jgi:L-fuculose-phosphate aldolase